MNNPVYHQPYAPSPYSYAPTPTLSSTISLDEEVKLSTTTAERTLYESLAEIYAIIVTLDFLETAFIRDSIKESEYTPICLRLLSQYKTLLKSEEVNNAFGGLEQFKQEYDMDYRHATHRINIGVPATYEQSTGGGGGAGGAGVGGSNNSPAIHATHMMGGGNPSIPITSLGATSARLVAECTQNFITFMDALSLDFKAKDQLHPLLSNVMSSLVNVTNEDFEGKALLVKWLIKLNAMTATEEMDKEDLRQMTFDTENVYKAFLSSLK